MQDLPIGIAEFTELRRRNCLYIDKTKFVFRLLTKDTRTFLSRPRRFGKSLLVSTLEAALQGKKELFEGLWIAQSPYSWEVYGVIRLDFSILSIESKEDFILSLKSIITDIAEDYNLSFASDMSVNVMMQSLIVQISKKIHSQSVAVLIDEYDHPILHTLHTPALAMEIRDVIKSFSCVIKALSKQVKFVFVTGVSAFSKSGLSSGLNNLKSLTMDENFFDICGYTDEEIDNYFPKYIQAWADLRNIPYQEIRENLRLWYNGYRFAENTPTIYSPFSLTCALDIKQVKNFWFESATPQVLLTEMKKEERRKEITLLKLDELRGTGDLLQTFEIEYLPLPSLLFQMGYLTIESYDPLSRNYTLKYPNLEVRASLHRHLVALLTKKAAIIINPLIGDIYGLLVEKNIEKMVHILSSLISDIPYMLHIEEEKFYHALIQIIFSAAGIDIQSEKPMAVGRMDLLLKFPHIIYVVELKMDQNPSKGLEQIERQKYYTPFLHRGIPIYALALSVFSKKGLTLEYAIKEVS